MKTLMAISTEKRKNNINIWAKIPQVIAKNLTKKMSNREMAIADMKFSLLLNEVQYNKELSELIKLTRSHLMLKTEELPQFNRRHIVMLFKRLKKYSDELIRYAERNWTNPNDSVCLDPDLILPLLDTNSGTSYAMACIAYVDMLDEMRRLVKRNATREDLLTQVYSARINCEKVLAPLQRLTSLRATLRKILDEEVDKAQLQTVNQTLDNISGILDRCYEVLTSLHGPHYVAELDNILDFSLKLMSMRHSKKDEQTGCNFEEMPSIDTLKSALLEKKETPYISNESQKTDHVSMVNDSSVASSIITISSATPTVDEDQEIYELVDLPWKKINALSATDVDSDLTSMSLDTQGSENHTLLSSKKSSFEITKSENEEPLYEEIGDINKCAEKKQNKEFLLDLEWKEVFRLFSATEELNQTEVPLKEAKYEIITSEYTYIKSLRKFMKLYYNSIEIQQSLSQNDFKRIFGNFPELLKCSETFLQDLLESLQEDVHLKNISNIVRTHVVACFDPYVKHCQKYTKTVKLLEILLRDNTKFRKLIVQKAMEEEKTGESLQSYLVLPCQRVSRLPLLLQTVLNEETPNTSEFNETILAFNAVHKLSKDCEEAINRPEDLKSKVEAPQPTARIRKDNPVTSETKRTNIKFTGLFTV
ncbi:hypothetical protein O3M35_012121 [Rhynocoris fuscipes]|uniref:DH domain-containing protein n=1 Tax=Rhynocoris fuscipes TaxID=488301 RepID=A0AAW1CSI2_9HEMI